MEPELILASSPADAGISCWDLRTGAEHLRYKSCASSSHGLTSVAGRFLASSQLQESKSSYGSVLYWSWNKPQVEVRSFPSEPIKALVSDRQGAFIAGGGASGDIYFWQVSTGKLLKKWHAHYRAVSCLVFNDDQSLLISGSEEGCIRVWSLNLLFDEAISREASHLYEYSFNDHSSRVTDIKSGHGRSSAIIVSASEDNTCKVWSLCTGKLVRNIVFPSPIEAISIDPGEHIFYAGSKDGKIYIVGLRAQVTSGDNYGPHIIGSLSENSTAVTCLASSADGLLLVSGSVDGMIRVWDTRTKNIINVLKHSKGPINNILVIRQPQHINARTSAGLLSAPLRRHGLKLPPPLEKFANPSDESFYVKAFIGSQTPFEPSYLSVQTMEAQMNEFQRQGSASAAEVDVERLKSEQVRSNQMIQHLKQMNENLHQFCVAELLNGSQE